MFEILASASAASKEVQVFLFLFVFFLAAVVPVVADHSQKVAYESSRYGTQEKTTNVAEEDEVVFKKLHVVIFSSVISFVLGFLVTVIVGLMRK